MSHPTGADGRSGSPEIRTAYLGLLRSGCRPNDIWRATFEDSETNAVTGVRIVVLTELKTAKKTGKPRRIPVGRKLCRLIENSAAGRTTGPLFRSPRGNAWTPSNLSRTFKEARSQAGFGDDLMLYFAHHHKGTIVCRNHGIQAAAQVLSHTTLATTQRNVHVSDEDLTRHRDG